MFSMTTLRGNKYDSFTLGFRNTKAFNLQYLKAILQLFLCGLSYPGI